MINKFDPRYFKEIKERKESRHMLRSVDEDWLIAFADHVINELNLDVTRPATYFDASEGEMGCSDLQDLSSCMAIGEEIEISVGYYSTPEPYRMMPSRDYKPCADCAGKGCGDWAGEECLSDEVILFRVRDLPAGHDKD